MFSPLENEELNKWFQRLEAAWRRMPAEERATQREEVQQHLEGLVAAKVAQGQSTEDAWNAALRQFGDPTRVGREIYQEWRQTHSWLCSDIAVISFAVGLQQAEQIAVQLLTNLVQSKVSVAFLLHMLLIVGYGMLIFTNATIGRKYPFQAIKGAFYGHLLWSLWGLVWLGVYFSNSYHTYPSITFQSVLIHNLLWMPLVLVQGMTAAYLASVTKRGWYRPSWGDFKITLPKRRRQAN